MYTKNKMISKEELQVVKVFRKDLFKEYSIKDIMKIMKKNSYSWVFNSVKKILKLDLIVFSEKAGIKLYSINWNNPLVFRYFSILDYENVSKLPIKNILDIINETPVDYFSLLIGGSYAKDKNVKNSDLDVIILVENKSDIQRVFNVINNKSSLMIPQVDLHVFSRGEFLEMLLTKEENFGKQVFENNLILFGAESYYLILKEAKENGFRS